MYNDRYIYKRKTVQNRFDTQLQRLWTKPALDFLQLATMCSPLVSCEWLKEQLDNKNPNITILDGILYYTTLALAIYVVNNNS